MRGVLHVLIGLIALQVAWSVSGKSADQSGALQTLAENTLGRLTLWVAVVGFLALGLWQFANALAAGSAPGSSPWAFRARSLSKGVAYLALASVSFSFANGHPRSRPPVSTALSAHCVSSRPAHGS